MRSWDDNGLFRWVRRYLGYSRGEARGLAALLLLMLALALAPRLLRPDLPVYLPAADQQNLNRLAADLQEHRLTDGFARRYPKREYPRYAKGGGYGGPRYPAVARVRLAPFDPNALTAEGWEARGVPHFAAARLVKYRDAAGGFRAKVQIKKMYGLADSVYQRLAPFMQLPDEVPRRDYAAERAAGLAGALPPAGSAAGKFAGKPKNLQPFDLNLADTTQLMQIRGIGSGRAKWVVRYRNQLGGYLRPEQLAEVFVLRDAPDLRDSLRKYTFIAPGFAPRRVNINAASFDELYLQPYIGKRLARVLVAYRNQHGPFKTLDELKLVPVLKAEELEKLRPYVTLE